MRRVYTNDNWALVGNAKNILERAGIVVRLKNEHSGGYPVVLGLGSWPEIWVLDDSDYQEAVRLIESALSPADAEEWICSGCKEKNDASFELCWNCHEDNK